MEVIYMKFSLCKIHDVLIAYYLIEEFIMGCYENDDLNPKDFEETREELYMLKDVIFNLYKDKIHELENENFL